VLTVLVITPLWLRIVVSIVEVLVSLAVAVVVLRIIGLDALHLGPLAAVAVYEGSVAAGVMRPTETVWWLVWLTTLGFFCAAII
jgi:hypothetical protein